MKTFHAGAAIALSFAAGYFANTLRAQSDRVFELRIYHTPPGKLEDLKKRFREHTIEIFNRHGIASIGYWVPQDADKGKENTLIYLIAHPSRDAAKKNWSEFGRDPEWIQVSKASEANGKIVEKVESTFLDPTDFSALK